MGLRLTEQRIRELAEAAKRKPKPQEVSAAKRMYPNLPSAEDRKEQSNEPKRKTS
jgi:hypothetical protein